MTRVTSVPSLTPDAPQRALDSGLEKLVGHGVCLSKAMQHISLTREGMSPQKAAVGI